MALLLLSFQPVKVNAKNFDYTDYVTSDSYVDGKNELKIRIPIDEFSECIWKVYYHETDDLLDEIYGNHFTWEEPGTRSLKITFNAFSGTTDESTDNLLIADIPDGSTLRLHYEIYDAFDEAYYTMSVRWTLSYFDVNYNYISTQISETQYADIEANAVDVLIQKPDKAVWMRCQVEWFPVQMIGGIEYSFFAEAFEFDISIDAMQREQQISGQTNKLLNKVIDTLNTDSGGAAQNSANSMNNVTGKLDSLGDAISNVPKPPVSSVDTNLNSYVSVDASTQTNNFFAAFWQSELFMSMLLLLLTMGTVSYVLFGKR